MTARTLPGLGLRGFYDPGEDGWGTAMSENLRALSILVQPVVFSRVDQLPDSPVAGDRHILTAEDSNSGPAGSIILFDGEVGMEDWVYITPSEGWQVYSIADAGLYRYTGGAWVVSEVTTPSADQVAYNPTQDSNSGLGDTDVATALDFIFGVLATIGEGGGTDDQTAAEVAYDPEQDSNSGQGVATVQEALDDLYDRVLNARTSFTNRSADFTITAADENVMQRIVDDSNSTATEILAMIPHDATENLPIGFTINFIQREDMKVHIVAEQDSNSEGITAINHPSDMVPRTRGQFSVISAVKEAANSWLVYGDMEAV